MTLPLVEGFTRAMPKARLALVEGFSVNIPEWLATGRIDLGLAYTPEPHPLIEITPVLQGEPVPHRPGAAVGGTRQRAVFPAGGVPAHRAAARAGVSQVMEAQAALAQVKLDVAWEVSSVPAILDLVRSGHGFAALTTSAMRGDAGSAAPQPGLVSVPIGGPRIVSTLCLVQSAKKKASPLVRRTAELLRSLSVQVCTPTAQEV